MKIVILGYMGAGKSTIGLILAKELGLNFVDLDDYIEQKENQSINQLFSSKGEIYFRKKEHQYLSEILELPEDYVLSLGGGTPCYGNNLNLITNKNNMPSVYLKGTIPFLCQRLFEEKAQRPLISHMQSKDQLTEYLGKHLFERNQFYNKADFTISIDNKSKEDIVFEIKTKLF